MASELVIDKLTNTAETKTVLVQDIITANSPAFTGVPTAPTASIGTNTEQLATTAFVRNHIQPTGGGTDQVFFENAQIITTNYTIPVGKNAMSAGDITIASGVTVVVSSGSKWSIV